MSVTTRLQAIHARLDKSREIRDNVEATLKNYQGGAVFEQPGYSGAEVTPSSASFAIHELPSSAQEFLNSLTARNYVVSSVDKGAPLTYSSTPAQQPDIAEKVLS